MGFEAATAGNLIKRYKNKVPHSPFALSVYFVRRQWLRKPFKDGLCFHLAWNMASL